MVKPESMENIDSANAASNDTPFSHIQARQVTGNQELLLSGRLEEKFLMPFSDSFEVAIGQSHFCLQIWVVQNRHNVKLSIRRYIVFSS